jgi:outer membrane protein assembly factor BamB
VTHTLHDGAVAVALGNPTAQRTGHDEPRAVAFMKGSSKPIWKGSLLVEGDEIHYGSAQSELHDGNLVTFYQAKSGPFELVSRSALTGTQRWSATIPDSAEGSYAAAFAFDGNRVLVVMNHTIHVFDAETGAHLAGLDASTI